MRKKIKSFDIRTNGLNETAISRLKEGKTDATDSPKFVSRKKSTSHYRREDSDGSVGFEEKNILLQKNKLKVNLNVE